jgi:hypothetical protein
MKTWIRPGLSVAGALLGIFLYVAPSHAQATRTWVSGVGDDAFPCSRTAPCKTFAGAISKTAAKGQINVLDPGSYGAVTITKSITIDATGNFAGVLSTLGSNAIVVNALSTDVVVLKGLTIDGAGTGGNGIRFLAGAALHIENCVINNFAQKGIDIEPTTSTFLFIKDTVVRNNVNAANGGGILLKPGVGGSIRAELDGVRVERNLFGLRSENNTETVVRNSVFAGSTGGVGIGIGVNAVGTSNAQINLEESIVSNNLSHGVQASGTNTFVRLSNTMVTNNNGTGIFPTLNGVVHSFGTNRIVGNGTNGTFSAGSPTQQ